jgi:hypothetical protein
MQEKVRIFNSTNDYATIYQHPIQFPLDPTVVTFNRGKSHAGKHIASAAGAVFKKQFPFVFLGLCLVGTQQRSWLRHYAISRNVGGVRCQIRLLDYFKFI